METSVAAADRLTHMQHTQLIQLRRRPINAFHGTAMAPPYPAETAGFIGAHDHLCQGLAAVVILR
jgi:hypothetical protein